jgi:hypothetical protein
MTRVANELIKFGNLALTQSAQLGLESSGHDATKNLRLVGLEHGAVGQVLVIEFPHQVLDVLADFGVGLE